MNVSTRPIGTALLVVASLLFSLLGSQITVAADDMWDGVFAYQKKMADYGNAEAQHKLGEMYEEGHGTAKDFDKALEWYQKAAAQGYAPASKKIEQVKLRKQRAIAEAKAEKERKLAEQVRLEREKAEQKKAEQERLQREKAAQLQAEKDAREKVEKERQAKLQEEDKKRQAKLQEEDKKRQAEEERLARERAEAAMKAMMAVPSAYAED